MQRKIDSDHAVFLLLCDRYRKKLYILKAAGKFDSQLICTFGKFYESGFVWASCNILSLCIKD